MKYSIVIPTYNHCDDLLKPCIDSILKFSKVSDIELIISANGCEDNTREYLQSLKTKFDNLYLTENFKVVWSDEPLGYSRACNAGINAATTDYIVLLNNDTVLLEQYKSQWLDLFESPFIKNEKCGISAVLKIHSPPAGHDFAVFFAVMIHRKVFDKIGLLNTEYGIGGGEDTEFCIEAERAGFEVCSVMETKWAHDVNTHSGNFPIYHKGEGTMHDRSLVPEWDKVFLENSLRLAKKYNMDWYNWKLSQLEPKSTIDFTFLQNQHKEIYQEVITENCYNITVELVKNKTVIDIGANIGAFSLFAASLSAKKIYAIEPVSSTFMQLCANINKCKLKNIVPIKNAVIDVAGEFVDINILPDFGHNGLYATSTNVETVYTTNLHELLKTIEGDDILLKIDCEGSEYDILMNASHEDMSRISRIVLETHAELNPKYKGFELMENKLKSFGFTVETQKTLFSWDINEKGEKVNWKIIPHRIEIWKR